MSLLRCSKILESKTPETPTPQHTQTLQKLQETNFTGKPSTKALELLKFVQGISNNQQSDKQKQSQFTLHVALDLTS